DQIKDIEAVTAKQKIISAEFDDWDVVALAVGIEYVCVQVYFVRKGRLSGRKNYFIDYNGKDSAEILASFLQQYYSNTEFIPNLILIPEETGDETVLEEYLRGRKGKKVEVRIPQRGEKKQLLDMAIKNAKQTLEEKELTEDSQYNMTIGALEDLSEILELSYVPHRIECFDISHIHGTDTVASMTVFIEGLPEKSQYRRFKLRSTNDLPNDYLSMQEVLTRRFTQGLRERELIVSGKLEEKKAKFATFPDLVVIDGGKGQLSAAIEVFKDVGLAEIPTISLAERLEEIYTKPEGEGILLSDNSRARHILERIRDEAHRFAITYHRKLRSRRQVKSRLDEVPGIGPKRKKALLRKFGSIEGIKKATLEEVLEVESMNRKAAEALLDFLK
ncbi:MAG: excinuclease ABC subunit UvrC, partial [Bacillota bacterium]